MIGLDVKAVRTRPAEIATKHLSHSVRVFLRLLALSLSLDREAVGQRDGKVLVRTEWGEDVPTGRRCTLIVLEFLCFYLRESTKICVPLKTVR